MAEAKAAGRVLLPDAVIPVRYEVRLEPDLEKYVFDGTVKIQVEVQEATDEIAVHAKELMINNHTIAFKPAEGEEMKPIEVRYNVKDTTLTVKFDGMLPVGAGTLEIEYVGCLNDQMAGFYRSSYKDIKGNKKMMASTQFESLDARRAFPCWDEPARKAIFEVTLVVDADLTAFSNMPESSCKFINGGKKKELTFMDSPKMSTYLLAFVVGEFDFVQAQTEHGVLVRVYTPPGRACDGEFALSVACKALDGYDDYFAIPYPLPKLDMVAIPEFAAGAMENWGLVTYREVDLLIAKGASCDQKQRVTIVVTHELAHQWFGNLVTMMWWDDLWLNEGFASWMENKLADDIFPDFCMWDQFVSDTQAAALRLDGLRTSHPIQVPIHRAEEVEEVFDAISYCKGACVIKMAHAYLGPADFQAGLKTYFAKHKYGNTETLDLWSAWGTASGKPVQELMATWTEQMGYPLVTVKSFKVEEKAGSHVAVLELEQSWFLADGSEVKPEDEKLWKIPLICRTCHSLCDIQLMQSKTMKVELPAAGANDFVKINAGQSVPMRVLYTEEGQARLAKSLVGDVLPAQDRAGLVLDAFALAKSGKMSADALVKLIANFSKEENYTVWDSIAQALAGLDNLLMVGLSSEAYKKFHTFASTLIQKISESLGWEKRSTDGHLEGKLRAIALNMQARFAKDPAIVTEARRRFDGFLAGDASLLPDDIKAPVYKIVLRSGGVKEYQALRGVHDKAETNVEKKDVLNTIGHTSDFTKKKEVLEWAISGEIKIQDFFYAVGSVSTSTKEAVAMTWEWYKLNFGKIQGMLKSANPSLMDAMIQYSARGFCSAARADEVEAFFKEHPLPGNQRTISQVLEGIRANAAFLDRILKTPVTTEAFWDEVLASLAA